MQDILNYNDVTDKDNLFLRNALIFGKAFELHYIDTDKKTRFDVIDTRFGIDVYSDELEKDELKYFIRMLNCGSSHRKQPYSRSLPMASFPHWICDILLGISVSD